MAEVCDSLVLVTGSGCEDLELLFKYSKFNFEWRDFSNISVISGSADFLERSRARITKYETGYRAYFGADWYGCPKLLYMYTQRELIWTYIGKFRAQRTFLIWADNLITIFLNRRSFEETRFYVMVDDPLCVSTHVKNRWFWVLRSSDWFKIVEWSELVL